MKLPINIPTRSQKGYGVSINELCLYISPTPEDCDVCAIVIRPLPPDIPRIGVCIAGNRVPAVKAPEYKDGAWHVFAKKDDLAADGAWCVELSDEKDGHINIGWTVDDVQTLCNTLTDDEASEVLYYMERNHDASIGINWDVIDSTIQHLYPEKYAEGNEEDEDEEDEDEEDEDEDEVDVSRIDPLSDVIEDRHLPDGDGSDLD